MFNSNQDKKHFEIYKLPSYINKNKEDVVSDLNIHNLTPIVLGNGSKVVKQYPKMKSELVVGDKVFILTNDKILRMPNLTGYTRSEAISLCEMLNIDYEIVGYGRVINQSIIADSEVKKGMKIIVTLEDKSNIN